MWFFNKPSERQFQSFLTVQSGQPFSYGVVGLPSGKAPAGFDFDHNRIELGKGEAVFETACTALGRWAMFPNTWTDVYPADRTIRAGDVVAVRFRVLGLWWLNACRIINVIDETEPIRRFGFTYGTLPDHVECGEERFSIEWHADDSVWYDIRAFSRPRFWLARIGYPIARRFQRRFVRDSQAAMLDKIANVLRSPSVPSA